MCKSAPVVWLACLGAGVAAAQTYEVSPFALYTRISTTGLGSIQSTGGKLSDSRFVKGGNGLGLRLTYNTPGYYGFEASYAYSRAVFEAKTTPEAATVESVFSSRVNIQQGGFNFLMYMMPKDERWRPYITVGGQATRYGAPSVPNWTHGAARTYGVNYGGGIKLRVFKGLLLRLDARDHIAGKPYDLSIDVSEFGSTGGIFRHQEYSAGFAIAF